MSCLLCGGRRKAKPVTVPAGFNPSLGHSTAQNSNRQQASYASEFSNDAAAGVLPPALSVLHAAQELVCSVLGTHAGAVQHPVQQTQAARCRMYQYNELQAATGNFSDSNVIGEGGFGRVFKGRLSSGAVVAVKRLDRHGMQASLY